MANFSSIKFNNVDYPLKDASARDSIASLQTSVSGLDTRVTALEQEVPEGVQTVTLPDEYDSGTGTSFTGLDTVDWEKPIFVKGRMTMDSGSVVMSQYITVLEEPDGEYGYSFSLIDEGGNVRLFQQEFVGHDSVFGGEIANKVIANGQETPTAELTKLTVNNTTYSVPKKIIEFASIDDFEQACDDDPTILVEGLTIKFTTTSGHTMITSDGPGIETSEEVYVIPQIISFSYLDSFGSSYIICKSTVEGNYYSACLTIEDGAFFLRRIENMFVVANPQGLEGVEYDELNTVRINNAFYEIPHTALIVTPSFGEIVSGDIEYHGVSIITNDTETIARCLYYGLRPVVAKYVHAAGYVDLDIASGELHLEKTTDTIVDISSGKSFNGGYEIKFKKPKSSPDVSQDSYYSRQEISGEYGATFSQYLVLDGGNPTIATRGFV